MRINRIYNADCNLILKNIKQESIDLIITDPPYLTTPQEWDKSEVFNEKVIRELFRVMKDSASIYVWCGIGEKSQSLIRWFPLLKEYFHFKDLITWKKQRGIGMRRGWLYTREEIMWFVKNNKKFVWNKEKQYGKKRRKIEKLFTGKKAKSKFKRLTNIWIDISEQNIIGQKNPVVSHYTPKPLKAIERIILLHTKKKDIILDPFLGSGTTAVAAKSLGRRYIGIEINKKFYKVAKRRLKETVKT